MLILRQITSEGLESNHVLGETYQVIKREEHTSTFRKNKCVLEMEKEAFEKCFAIILFTRSEKEQTYPLYKGHKYYIMSDAGRTFDNLTYKPF